MQVKAFFFVLFLSFIASNFNPIAAQSLSEEQARAAYKSNKVKHFATDWFLESQKEQPDVLLAEQLFDDYVAEHPNEPSKVKTRFQHWLKAMKAYTDADGKLVLPEFEAKNRQNIQSRDSLPADWKHIGPAKMAFTHCNNNNLVTGGFCDRVYVNPYNTQNLFAGFSYGGLWVSHNQGETWSLTDAEFPNGTNTYANRDYYYGEIEAQAQNSDLAYAATEAGLLKSINGGANWEMLPELNRNASPTNRPYYIALANDNADIILSTFGRQTYRSTDAGMTWETVFDNTMGGSNHRYTSQYTQNTPFGLNERTFNFFGLEANLEVPGEFFLGVWKTGNQACIYKSTDYGATFSLLVNINTTHNTNWSGSTSLGMKTIPGVDGVFVYEMFAENKPLYKFASDGTLLSANPINAYVEAFDIDWLDENNLYQGQYSPDYITKSTNAGATFAKPYQWGSCNYVHADIRGISAVGDVVLVGNDGGLALSTDGGKRMVGTGFEINSMDIWGFSSSPSSDICLAGLDHNQTFVRRSADDEGWINIKGADAGDCSIHPYDDRWLYFDWAYGVNRGYLNPNGSVTQYSVAVDVNLESLQFHPTEMDEIYGSRKDNKALLVYSTDNMETAQTIHDFGKNINMLRISRTDGAVLYVLLANNEIQKTTDGGQTWTTVTPSNSVTNNQNRITSIDVGATSDEVFAAYGNAQNDCKTVHSLDGGLTWTNITTPNLPAFSVSSVDYQTGTNSGVYLAIITDYGTTIWFKSATMPQWEQSGSTLPMFGYITNRLFPVPSKGKLRFGTSRGAYEGSLYTSLVQTSTVSLEKSFELYPNPTKEFFYINLEQTEFATAQITIFDATGRLIQSQSSPKNTFPLKISTKNWAKGVYVVQLKMGDASVLSRRVLVE